jgi:hypothetical protein
LLEDRRLINTDQAEILERAAAWQKRLAETDKDGDE